MSGCYTYNKVYYVSRFGLTDGKALGWYADDVGSSPSFGSPFSSKVAVCGYCLLTLPPTDNDSLKWLSSLPVLMQNLLFWW